jgi:CheY-like chemotaxis protein
MRDAADGDPPRILVVEDNALNQTVLQRMLRTVGYEADVAPNGRVALDKLAEADYGLVLMDCNMPVMDGFAATAAIRALSTSTAQIPIVALTASATESDRERVLAAGMDDYLAKPVTRETLGPMLARWYGAASGPGAPRE